MTDGSREEQQKREDLTFTLVGRLREGDEGAGQKLLALYHADLRRFCANYLPRPEDAEDVVQDVFCRAIASRTVPDSFRAWIYGIARNRCLDILRARARHPGRDEPLPQEPSLAADDTGDLTRLVRGEARSRLQHALAALPVAQREILRLRYTEGLSRSEIAQVLGITEKVVKSRLFEGLEKLRGHTSLAEDH